MRPEELELDVLGHRTAVLAGYADRPRAVLLALHGGGASKEYFDTPTDPSLSLLRLGPALGFTVIAPDRPGYGADPGEDSLDAERRTDLLFAGLDAALRGRSGGAGTLLLGHSLGCVSALRMAADGRVPLLGIEISGIGLAHHPDVHGTGGGQPRQSLRRLIWGPDELYPQWTRQSLRMPPTPPWEGDDARGWPAEMPRLAARVRVPVRYSLAEHESWWRPGPEALREVAALFTAAPYVETAIEPGAGHNVSIGLTARAYHLRVLAFAEQCLARAVSRRTDPRRSPRC